MKPRLFIVPAVITAFSLVVIGASLRLDLSPAMIVGDSMQPRSFPIFLMVINLVLVALLTWHLHREGPRERTPETWATWGSIVLMALFYVLATYVDLFIGIAVVMFLMCRLWGERRILVASAIGGVAADPHRHLRAVRPGAQHPLSPRAADLVVLRLTSRGSPHARPARSS